MILADALLILASPFVGILIGLIPSLGATLAMIIMYPFLINFNPITVIVFYAVMVNARDFSGSVSALSFGLLGEITSIPALKERQFVVNENLQINALRNTMIGSIVGMLFGTVLLYISVSQSTNYPFLLRSDVLAFFILVTAGFLTFWLGNKWYTNILLMASGYFLGEIGYNTLRNSEFFTFGNSYLSGGIPLLPLLFGIYAVPKMIEIWKNNSIEMQVNLKDKIIYSTQTPTLLRGSLIGSICGLIPFVGTTISSNMAYFVEGKIYKKHNGEQALLRVSAAETANNAGQVTMLIPLLVLGLALQPSELILLDILEFQGWIASDTVDWTLLLLITVILPLGSLLTAFLCYNAVKSLLTVFSKHYKNIILLLISITVIDIFYIGYTSDQTIYYALVFLISLTVGMTCRKIDFVPLVMMFLLHNSFSDVIMRLPVLYGF